MTFLIKQLPTHLRYAFLDENKNYPVIVNASLKPQDEEKLLRILRKYKQVTLETEDNWNDFSDKNTGNQ